MKPRLTPRHREVIRLISLGCTGEEIAAILDIAPATRRQPSGRRDGSTRHGQGRAGDSSSPEVPHYYDEGQAHAGGEAEERPEGGWVELGSAVSS